MKSWFGDNNQASDKEDMGVAESRPENGPLLTSTNHYNMGT